MLDHGASANAADNNGWRALHWAARGRSVTLVQTLLDRGADLNAKTKASQNRRSYVSSPVNETALHLSADQPDIVRALIEKGADVNARDSKQRTPLFTAAMYGSEEAVKLLLDHGADVNARDADGQTPLWQALGRYDSEAVAYLLAHGASVNVADTKGQTMLYAALAYEGTRIAEFVVVHDAQVNVKDSQGRTPLHYVASGNWWTDAEEKARFLVAHGAKTTAKDNAGKTPLAIAVASGTRDVAVYLHSVAGPARGSSKTVPSLLTAAAKGDTEGLKAMLARGAKMNAKDDLGETALHAAVSAGSRETVNLLLMRGANPNAADRLGWTPLHAGKAGPISPIPCLPTARS
jgi:ankyrin repeat protein